MAKEESKKIKNNNFKNFRAELKKVIWPTPKQLANNTVAVITIVLITALVVFGLDFIFELVNKYGVNKIRDAVTSNNNSVVTSTSQELTNNVQNTETTSNVEGNNTETSDVTSEDASNTAESNQTETQSLDKTQVNQ